MSPAQQAAVLLFISQFITSAKVSGFVVWAIEKLKTSQIPWLNWINHNTAWVNRIVATVGAIATASGVSYTYDHTLGIITITGLTAAGMGTALWHVAQNYLMQHGWYKAVFETPAAQQK